MLLSAGESLTLWNVETGQPARTVSLKRVLPASPRSASGDSARMVRFRENPNISVAAFSPDGKVLAGAAGERGAGEVFVWDVSAGLPSGKPKRILIGHKGQVESLAFSPDGKILAAGGGEELPFDYGEGNHGVVTLWDVSGGKRIAILLGYEGVNAIAFSPDGTVLASGCGNEDGDRWGEVQLWDVKTKKLLRYLHGHGNYVETVAFAPDARTLASGSYGEIKLWDIGTGKLRRTIKAEGSTQLLAFSGDGQRLLSAARDATVQVWNTATGSLRVTFLVLPSAKEETKRAWTAGDTAASGEWIAFTPAGYYIASPGAGKFIRWRISGPSDDQLFPAAKYKSTFHRPDLVWKALQGG
jgi:WD40 repeat protein